jgi:hypothetical protein
VPVTLAALIAPAAEPIEPLRLTLDVEPLAQMVELNLDPARDDYSGRVRRDAGPGGQLPPGRRIHEHLHARWSVTPRPCGRV